MPYSSSREFCKGVAVSSTLGAWASASFSVLPITLPGLYTLRRRWASSITTKSQRTRRRSSALVLANW